MGDVVADTVGNLESVADGVGVRVGVALAVTAAV
jgi:hypothetical protein